ncbi:tRNA uracil 4-sulfurtransferase ThiI [Methanocella conradii]|uniref:tRNA uracil 4-sulfurtransferase ThiI n=1 Tax=Methanocella conradii TaxID=1175444 RepID=UPI00157C131A|nr:tRNA uracil 4-sulfurtransferase ThiI [Methanocella conradii]
MDFDLIIVRYGEIGIKSEPIRRKYENLLVKNIHAMLATNGVDFEDIARERGRIYVKTKDEGAIQLLSKVFGVVSCSPAISAGSTVEEAAKFAADVARNIVKDGESFAIVPRNASYQKLTPMEIGRICGDAVFEAIRERKPHVDLRNAKHRIHVELRDSGAYVFTGIVPGVGGMPLGSQGKMVAMVSGGIDSPVAAWLMMKRGCEIVPVFFHNAPYFDDTTMERALNTLKKLKEWCPGHEMKAYIMPHGRNLQAFLEKGNQKYTCVFCKHLMYKVSRAIAEKEGAHGIVTGSSLGQVASQTSDNMLAEAYDVDFPVYHPLIGLDKEEIVGISKKIGLFDISIQKAAGCRAVPKHPSIHGRREEVIKMEREQFDFDELVALEVENAKEVTL